MRITTNPVADAASFYDARADEALADDARDAYAAHEVSRLWSHIQEGRGIHAGYSTADSLVNDLGDLIAQDDAFVSRLITNAAGMRKQDPLRNWYAEAIAKDVEALVARAIESAAFAAALEAF